MDYFIVSLRINYRTLLSCMQNSDLIISHAKKDTPSRCDSKMNHHNIHMPISYCFSLFSEWNKVALIVRQFKYYYQVQLGNRLQIMLEMEAKAYTISILTLLLADLFTIFFCEIFLWWNFTKKIYHDMNLKLFKIFPPKFY